jgi:prepilin-type N-terminal cleavage/methylation domain-containing protein
MTNFKIHKNGFTIIEVLIVLAVAGLIMVIVFLAVPSLQRNSRNMQRKNDIGLIAAAITSYKTINPLSVPDILKNEMNDTTLVSISSLGSTNNYETVKLGYYNRGGNPDNTWGPAAGNVYIDVSKPQNPLVSPEVAPPGSLGTNAHRITDENVSIISGETCNDTGTGPGVLSNGAVAIFYVLEGASDNGILKCIDA